MEVKNQNKNRLWHISTGFGAHPVGGYIAWRENENLSEEEKERIETIRKYRARKKFVSWPEKFKEAS